MFNQSISFIWGSPSIVPRLRSNKQLRYFCSPISEVIELILPSMFAVSNKFGVWVCVMICEFSVSIVPGIQDLTSISSVLGFLSKADIYANLVPRSRVGLNIANGLRPQS